MAASAVLDGKRNGDIRHFQVINPAQARKFVAPLPVPSDAA
jgi:hypothetical protein